MKPLRYLITLAIIFALSSTVAAQQYLTGNIEYIRGFSSEILPDKRDVIIYLPPDYYQNTTRRYPVFYMHDGQNLFDGNTSFIKGQEWRVDESAERLILDGVIEPLIIVGIYNTGVQRVNEYTPSFDEQYQTGGRGDLYGRLIVEELKPQIDARYRTLTEPEHTALGGSSLGGLISIYLGLKYPQVFGKLAVISPSVWWDNRYILGYVARLPEKQNIRIWEDIGTKEGQGFTANQMAKLDARKLRDALIKKGWTNADLKYYEAKGAGHNEAAWAARFPEILKYLFPSKIK